MKKTEGRTKSFLRRNAVYFILAFCILAVGLSLTLILTSQNRGNNIQLENQLPDEPEGILPDTPVDTPEDDLPDTPVNNPNQPSQPTPSEPVVTVVSFIMPVANATEIGGYSETVVFNSTLNRFTGHKAVDFYAEEGTPVLAVYDGVIEKVENSPLITGVTVTIDHGNGLKTVYNSLADTDDAVVGQRVTQGQKIGEASVSNKQEYKSGAHLHFAVYENGEAIDPAKYISFEEK